MAVNFGNLSTPQRRLMQSYLTNSTERATKDERGSCLPENKDYRDHVDVHGNCNPNIFQHNRHDSRGCCIEDDYAFMFNLCSCYRFLIDSEIQIPAGITAGKIVRIQAYLKAAFEANRQWKVPLLLRDNLRERRSHPGPIYAVDVADDPFEEETDTMVLYLSGTGAENRDLLLMRLLQYVTAASAFQGHIFEVSVGKTYTAAADQHSQSIWHKLVSSKPESIVTIQLFEVYKFPIPAITMTHTARLFVEQPPDRRTSSIDISAMAEACAAASYMDSKCNLDMAGIRCTVTQYTTPAEWWTTVLSGAMRQKEWRLRCTPVVFADHRQFRAPQMFTFFRQFALARLFPDNSTTVQIEADNQSFPGTAEAAQVFPGHTRFKLIINGFLAGAEQGNDAPLKFFELVQKPGVLYIQIYDFDL